MEKFKIINEKLKRGVWLSEYDFIKLLNVLKHRNIKLYNKLKEDYEFLIGEID